MKNNNPFGEALQAAEALALLEDLGAWDPQEEAYLAEVALACGICDGLHRGLCPLESPDPLYYADELAAGR